MLIVRRPNDELHSVGHSVGVEPIDEAAVRDAIRDCRETSPLAADYRMSEVRHARQLAVYWSRLPLSAQRELARTWIGRSERRNGKLPTIDDPDDLHEVSRKTLVAARGLGLTDGDNEAAAQEEDVRAAFEKHIGP